MGVIENIKSAFGGGKKIGGIHSPEEEAEEERKLQTLNDQIIAEDEKKSTIDALSDNSGKLSDLEIVERITTNALDIADNPENIKTFEADKNITDVEKYTTIDLAVSSLIRRSQTIEKSAEIQDRRELNEDQLGALTSIEKSIDYIAATNFQKRYAEVDKASYESELRYSVIEELKAKQKPETETSIVEAYNNRELNIPNAIEEMDKHRVEKDRTELLTLTALNVAHDRSNINTIEQAEDFSKEEKLAAYTIAAIIADKESEVASAEGQPERSEAHSAHMEKILQHRDTSLKSHHDVDTQRVENIIAKMETALETNTLIKQRSEKYSDVAYGDEEERLAEIQERSNPDISITEKAELAVETTADTDAPVEPPKSIDDIMREASSNPDPMTAAQDTHAVANVALKGGHTLSKEANHMIVKATNDALTPETIEAIEDDNVSAAAGLASQHANSSEVTRNYLKADEAINGTDHSSTIDAADKRAQRLERNQSNAISI